MTETMLGKFRLNLWQENLQFWMERFWSDKILQNDESTELIFKAKNIWKVDEHFL